MSVPKQFAAGATLLFSETFVGYSATLYNLTFNLNLAGCVVANVAGSASGDSFVITSPPSTTSAWKPGRYNWSEVVTLKSDSTNVTQLCSGQTIITPNFAIGSTATAAQQQLAAINATILKVLSTRKSVSFNGQSVTQRDLKELFDARDRVQATVNAELRAAGLSNKGGAVRIVTQFQS